MLDLLIASLVLLLIYNILVGTIKAIAKENKEQDTDQENDGLNPVQALNCLESFNHSCGDLNILTDCIKTLDNSELGELSGYNLKYTKNKETKKIKFEGV